MRITISADGSEKIDFPDSSRLEATCAISVYVDDDWIERDPEGILRCVKNAVVACRHAVEEELASKPRSGGDDVSHCAADQAASEPTGSHFGNNVREVNGYYNGDACSRAISTQL